MIEITLGAMAPPLSEQLKGCGLSQNRLKFYDKLAHCLAMCSIHGLLTDSEKSKASNRLVKAIEREIGKL